MARARSEDFKSPPCRLAFSQGLFKLRAIGDSTVKRYGCTLIFEEKWRPQLEKKIAEVIVAEWGDKGLARAKVGGIRNPILKGDGKEARSKQTGELHPGFGPGLVFIRCQANEDFPPQMRTTEDADNPALPSEVYSGCYGFAVLNCFAWNHPQNGDGVSFGIRYFQKTRDGESIGGAKQLDVNEWHEGVEDDGGALATRTRSTGGAGGLFG